MKKFCLAIAVIMAVSFVASGCVSISKYTPPKNEDDAPVMKMGGTGKTAPKVKVEIELLEKPDLSRFSDPRTPDKEVNGNRGYLLGGSSKTGSSAVAENEQPKAWWSSMPQEQAPRGGQVEEAVPQAVEPVMTKYKVKKGQTLADVSKDVYGTTKKWKKIYEANSGKIKNPDKIYAGQILNIPQEESVKHLK